MNIGDIVRIIQREQTKEDIKHHIYFPWMAGLRGKIIGDFDDVYYVHLDRTTMSFDMVYRETIRELAWNTQNKEKSKDKYIWESYPKTVVVKHMDVYKVEEDFVEDKEYRLSQMLQDWEKRCGITIIRKKGRIKAGEPLEHNGKFYRQDKDVCANYFVYMDILLRKIDDMKKEGKDDIVLVINEWMGADNTPQYIAIIYHSPEDTANAAKTDSKWALLDKLQADMPVDVREDVETVEEVERIPEPDGGEFIDDEPVVDVGIFDTLVGVDENTPEPAQDDQETVSDTEVVQTHLIEETVVENEISLDMSLEELFAGLDYPTVIDIPPDDGSDDYFDIEIDLEE